jgi:hypothetical protein
MFQDVTVKNFRCFVGLQLAHLGRVNLIAGKNNTGKTALLEAVRLFCDPGNCGLPNEINKERGIEDPLRSYEEVVSWLFYGRNPSTGAEVSSQDDKRVARSLTIRLIDAAAFRELFPESMPRVGLFGDVGQGYGPFLILEYRGQKGETATAIGFSHGSSFSWNGTLQH